MNIGIFTDTFYPEINGVVTSIRILEKELLKKGHNVYIVTTSHPDVKQSDSRIIRLPSIPFVFLPSRRVGTVYSPTAARIIRKLNLDIIHTHTEFSLGNFGKRMARQLGIPVIHTYHTMYKDYVHYISKGKLVRVTNEIAKQFSKNYCSTCHTIIAPTEKVENLLKDYGVKKPIRVIPTGINLEPFRKENYRSEELQELKRSFGISPDDSIVLFVGRLAKEKSIDVVVNQMPALIKKHPKAKFLIVGDGPSRKDLEALAKKLNCEKSVIFTGEQPWDSIGKFYQLGDVFVSASVTETQGLTFAEAMAAHIPVVAKQDKSIEGIIEDRKTGRVFANDEQLAEVLYELLTDEEQTKQIIENAYEMVELLSAENFGKKVENVYMDVLEVMNRVRSTIPG